MKYSGIGGQAVIEGIMMMNRNDYAVAVRKPDQEIEVKRDRYISITQKVKLFSLPFVRGVFRFADSMIVGMKTLTYSASFFALPQRGFLFCENCYVKIESRSVRRRSGISKEP